MRLYKIVHAGTDEILADRVRIADNFCSRSVGLLNRRSFEPGEGLLIKPCNSIHTFFMKFPIDVIFLDRNGIVLKMVESIPPWRFASCTHMGYMTLELPDGTLKNKKIALGSSIKIQKTP